MRGEGKGVDITAINVIIQASIFFGDIQRAVGTYKSIPEYGIKPNVDTFNLLLSACVAVGHRVSRPLTRRDEGGWDQT